MNTKLVKRIFEFSNFWQVPLCIRRISPLNFETLFIYIPYIVGLLQHVHRHGNHLIRVFAFSQWHSVVPLLLLHIIIICVRFTLFLCIWELFSCVSVYTMEVSHISSFPIMLFDDRRHLKCDLTRWQNGNVCFKAVYNGAVVG